MRRRPERQLPSQHWEPAMRPWTRPLCTPRWLRMPAQTACRTIGRAVILPKRGRGRGIKILTRNLLYKLLSFPRYSIHFLLQNLNPTGHTHGPITQTQNPREHHNQDKPSTRPHTPTHTRLPTQLTHRQLTPTPASHGTPRPGGACSAREGLAVVGLRHLNGVVRVHTSPPPGNAATRLLPRCVQP